MDALLAAAGATAAPPPPPLARRRRSTDDGGSGSDAAELDADAEAARVAAGAAVIAEVRAARKAAKVARARREAGLPPLSAASAPAPLPTAPAAAASYTSDDPSTVPLRTDTSRAYSWLLRAASSDHADAQVALGNLCMSAGDGAQGAGWYALAAQVTHHSLPGSMAGGGVAGSGDGSPLFPYRQPGADGATARRGGGGGGGGDDADTARHTVAVGADGKPRMVPAQTAGAVGGSRDEDAAAAAALLTTSAAPSARGSLPHTDALFNLGMLYWEGLPGA
jgi:hypothetical protein